ncbi:hypothetical protein [Sediminivirga luteola]|uniref:Uncharacterized protein n=1 Tax=Sediminivirga luteola TaxID=1774748 RepID=A0A8J2TX45_9MICO|nr:hypothetical protein [Sediminivirga luteola]GGA10844.1 hypothetical protein GCM10011333_12080 [Sediminivirga luteola]
MSKGLTPVQVLRDKLAWWQDCLADRAERLTVKEVELEGARESRDEALRQVQAYREAIEKLEKDDE